MEETSALSLRGYVLHIGKREAEEASAYTGQPWESQSFCLHVSFQDKTKTTCRGKQNVSFKKKKPKHSCKTSKTMTVQKSGCKEV